MPAEAFSPAPLGPITLRNRIIQSATFEGVMPDALVTEELIEYHRRVAAGGVGMSTVAYVAVSAGGRTNAECLYMRDPGAAQADRRDSRRRRPGLGADRPCRPGRQRQVQRRHELRTVQALQSPVDAHDAGGD